MSWQESYIDHIKPRLQKYADYIGTAALGSFAYGDDDEYSDLDLLIVTLDVEKPDVATALPEIARQGGDLAACYDGSHLGKPNLHICLYDNPMRRVDLKGVPLAEYISDQVQQPKIVDDPKGTLAEVANKIVGRYSKPKFQYIENRFWVWIINCAQKVRRGDLFEALNYVSVVRKSALLPLIHFINGSEPRGYRNLHVLAPEYEKLLHKTHPIAVSKSAITTALQETVDLYRKLSHKLPKNEIVKELRAEELASRLLTEMKEGEG
jgi:hypothetical protein